MKYLDSSNLATQQNCQCKRNSRNWNHCTTSSRNQTLGVYQERSEGPVEDRNNICHTYVTSVYILVCSTIDKTAIDLNNNDCFDLDRFATITLQHGKFDDQFGSIARQN